MTIENQLLLPVPSLFCSSCLMCLSCLSLPSMADINTWDYCSFSQPHPYFLLMVWSRGVSVVAGFEEEEEGRTNLQVSCSLVTLTNHVFPAMYNLLSSHSYPLLFHSLFFDIWLYSKSQDPILAPDWYHRNDHWYLYYIQGNPQPQNSKDAPNISNCNSIYFPSGAISKICFGKL